MITNCLLSSLGLNAIEFLCGLIDEDHYQTTVKEYEGPFGKTDNIEMSDLKWCALKVTGTRSDSATTGSS